ncbi:lytic transglycosylase domain-containing protein [Flavihumibacter fluvii]|uniref:lytic transglycosylase domain-containing protein n=1 Tax=Flavihumibacter fluvii TaxID=2838157 RepID=UPI001BDEF4B6|nr:lytic transglycosylase domain-containing protein [Flavihumibacter fluvii]ULQ52578.1 lytic transglycosylase domain-containing protein [Flavihumibacter fluvii]
MKQFLEVCAFLTGSLLSFAQEPRIIAGPQMIADTLVEKTPVIGKSSEIITPVVIKDLFESDNYASATAPKLNPRAVSFVADYIDKNSKDMLEMKGWALPYFNMMDAIMVQHGLPRELKYLAVIESELKSSATSWAGAVGPWQLMPGTAKTLGLKVNRKVDERRNYIKSTHAAARYLKDLYSIYGDWLLVIASYNAGPGSVQKAISRSGSRNFWDLQYYLPAETRGHVKKFIGTHYIFEGQGGLTTLTKAETKAHYGPNLYAFSRNLTREEQEAAKSQMVSGKYQATVIAKYVAMDPLDFNRYNPDFDRVMASNTNSYEMKLPAEKMDMFKANKYIILQESVQLLLNSTVVNEPKNSGNRVITGMK